MISSADKSLNSSSETGLSVANNLIKSSLKASNEKQSGILGDRITKGLDRVVA